MPSPTPRLSLAMRLLLVGIAAIGLTCLATLMFAFVGGNSASTDASALVDLQRVGVALNGIVIAACLVLASRDGGFAAGLKSLWARVPGWLLFAAGMGFSLAFFGELSYVIVSLRAPEVGEWFNHASLLCLGSACIAAPLLFGLIRRIEHKPAYSKGRW